MQEFLIKLQYQILKQLPGFEAQYKMAPPSRDTIATKPANARIGAVMIVLFLQNNEWNILLMRRTADGGTHSGQISFAGGKYDAQDGCVTYTAMRELQEEMGIHHTQYTILGQLTPLYIPPSNFYVTPIVAVLHDALQVVSNAAEVDEIIQMPIAQLLDDSTIQQAVVYRSDDANIAMTAPVYVLNNTTKIWGATAMMLSELKELLQLVK
jgi:8-oxo-dGTP pyrophosphatase MutT (NUDIX family)